jgi:hypothetical protein
MDVVIFIRKNIQNNSPDLIRRESRLQQKESTRIYTSSEATMVVVVGDMYKNYTQDEVYVARE